MGGWAWETSSKSRGRVCEDEQRVQKTQKALPPLQQRRVGVSISVALTSALLVVCSWPWILVGFLFPYPVKQSVKGSWEGEFHN